MEFISLPNGWETNSPKNTKEPILRSYNSPPFYFFEVPNIRNELISISPSSTLCTKHALRVIMVNCCLKNSFNSMIYLLYSSFSSGTEN